MAASAALPGIQAQNFFKVLSLIDRTVLPPAADPHQWREQSCPGGRAAMRVADRYGHGHAVWLTGRRRGRHRASLCRGATHISPAGAGLPPCVRTHRFSRDCHRACAGRPCVSGRGGKNTALFVRQDRLAACAACQCLVHGLPGGGADRLDDIPLGRSAWGKAQSAHAHPGGLGRNIRRTVRFRGGRTYRYDDSASSTRTSRFALAEPAP